MTKIKEYYLLYKDAFSLSLGLAIVQIVNFVFNIFYAKMYSVEAFGIMGLFLAIVLIASEIINLKTDQAIMMTKTEEESYALLKSSLKIGFIVTFLLCLIFLSIDFWYDLPVFSMFMYLLGIAISQPFMVLLNKNGNNTALNNTRIFQIIVTGITSIVLVQITPNYGLIWGMVLGIWLSIIPILFWSKIDLKKLIQLKQKYAIDIHQFITYGSFSSLTNTLSRSLPYFFIEKYFGNAFLGQFSFASKVLTAPLAVVTSAMGQFYYRKGSTLGNKELFDFTKDTMQLLSTIIVIPALIIMSTASFIFPYIFGMQWQIAGNTVALLMIWQMMAFVANPICMYFDIKFDLKKELIINILVLVLRIIVLWICVHYCSYYGTVAFFSILGFLLNIGIALYLYKRNKKAALADTAF
jgi:teichuronic acid exporter